MLKIIPLGGLGEIGLNMMVFERPDSILVVDAGLMFPEDYMLGIDYVIPNIDYLKKNKSKIDGIVLTHAHEDHIGALPYLLKEINAPVFGTRFTLGMVRHKLEEHNILSHVSLREISCAKKITIGTFTLEFASVSHSVVDGIGIIIHTPAGRIVHTGDFKICNTCVNSAKTDINKFALCGEKGVLALLSDSTNVEKEGYTISDEDVGTALEKVIAQSKGRVIVALFASSVSRIQQIVDIAIAKGSKVVVNGRSVEVSVGIAQELGYLNIPEKIRIDINQINNFPDDKILIITTGSQGEPMSALARMARGDHRRIKIQKGDTVILSSKFIPGNEKAIAGIINNLYRQGANVIYEKISAIHVSGHAFQEELKMMINLTKPKYFIPIHGEYRHLVLHARLAEQTGISKENILLAENGQVIVFDEDGTGSLRNRITTGRVLIDGKGVGDIEKSVLKERRILSEDGFVVVNMAFDEETGIIIYGPDVVSRGFVQEIEKGYLLEDAKCVILEIVEEMDPNMPNRINVIQSKIQTALKKYFYFAIKRRPVILPFILEI